MNLETGTIVPHGKAKSISPTIAPDARIIFGVRVSVYSKQTALERIANAVASAQHLKIAFLNAHGANVAWVDDEYVQDLLKFDVLADGIGVDMGSLINYGSEFPDNLNGTDFIPALIRHLNPGKKIALLGAAPGVAEAAAKNLQIEFPKHQFSVVANGYFSIEEENGILKKLKSIKPDILLVALGNPAQEKWIAKNCNKDNCTVAFGVGAYLDFAAGRVPRAPEILRKLRIEWAFRLWLEPGRMWKRYMVGNPLFILRSFLQKFGHKRHRLSRHK